MLNHPPLSPARSIEPDSGSSGVVTGVSVTARVGPTVGGVPVTVRVGVRVGVADSVPVGDGDGVFVRVGVLDGEGVLDGVGVSDCVGVFDGVKYGVIVGVFVNVGVSVCVGVGVSVRANRGRATAARGANAGSAIIIPDKVTTANNQKKLILRMRSPFAITAGSKAGRSQSRR